MNAGKLYGIIILLMFLLLTFGVIIITSLSMLANVTKTWLILLFEKYCKLVKANRHTFGDLNEPD